MKNNGVTKEEWICFKDNELLNGTYVWKRDKKYLVERNVHGTLFVNHEGRAQFTHLVQCEQDYEIEGFLMKISKYRENRIDRLLDIDYGY